MESYWKHIFYILTCILGGLIMAETCSRIDYGDQSEFENDNASVVQLSNSNWEMVFDTLEAPMGCPREFSCASQFYNWQKLTTKYQFVNPYQN